MARDGTGQGPTSEDDRARGGGRGKRNHTRSFAGGGAPSRKGRIMTLATRSLLRLAVAAVVLVGLVGCGRTESYRYKLTLAVNTPEGVKRGSSIVEVTFWEVSVPARGIMHKLRGEALYLDMGAGARPLV